MTPTEQIDAIWDKWAYKPQFFMMKGHVQEEENSLEKRKQQFRQDILSVCKTMMRDATKGIGQKAVEVVDKYIEIGEQLTTRQIEVMIEVIEQICTAEILESVDKMGGEK